MITRLITIYIPAGIILFCACIANAQTAVVEVSVRVQNSATLGVDPNELNQIEPDAGEPREHVHVEVFEDEYGNVEVRF